MEFLGLAEAEVFSHHEPEVSRRHGDQQSLLHLRGPQQIPPTRPAARFARVGEGGFDPLRPQAMHLRVLHSLGAALVRLARSTQLDGLVVAQRPMVSIGHQGSVPIS